MLKKLINIITSLFNRTQGASPVQKWATAGVSPTAAMVEAEMRAMGLGDEIDDDWRRLEETYSDSILTETGRSRDEVKEVRSYYGPDQNGEVEVKFADGERWVATVVGNSRISS